MQWTGIGVGYQWVLAQRRRAILGWQRCLVETVLQQRGKQSATQPQPMLITQPNTCVLPGMFHRQESASKITPLPRVRLGTSRETVINLKAWKLTKVGLVCPMLLPWLVPWTIEAKETLLAALKGKINFTFHSRIFLTSTELPGQVVFGWGISFVQRLSI